MNITNQIFELWNCKTTSTFSYLEASPYIRCDDPMYHAMWGYSIALFILFVIGFPVGIGLLNRFSKFPLHSISVKSPYWYWEPYLLLRKVVFTFLISFLANQTNKLMAIICLLVFFLLGHITTSPYQHWFNNLLETVTLCHVLLYFISGVLLQSQTASFTPGAGLQYWNQCFELCPIGILILVFGFKMYNKFRKPKEVAETNPTIIELQSVEIRVNA